MKFSRLVIKNFRSIGPEGIELKFAEERNVAVLVGANGAGKSNILHALGIVLGVFPFNRFEVEEKDFFNKDTDHELLIELHLAPPLKGHDVYQKEYEIHGFRFRAWRKMRGDGKGLIAQEHYCFGSNGRTIVKPQRIFKKAKDDGTSWMKEHVPWAARELKPVDSLPLLQSGDVLGQASWLKQEAQAVMRGARTILATSARRRHVWVC